MEKDIEIHSIKGLFPYNSGESNTYLRDEDLLGNFFTKLEKDHFVVLSGDSGTGKTSFLNCAFDDQFKDISNINHESIVIYFRPGLNPFFAFANALSTREFTNVKLSNNFIEETADLLLQNVNGLAELFNKYPITPGKRVYIVIDPFDDVFTYKNVMQLASNKSANQHVEAFINLLCYFEKQCRKFPVYLTLSFSNTFPDNINRFPKFIELIEKNKTSFIGYSLKNVDRILEKISSKDIKSISDYDQFATEFKDDLLKHCSHKVEWLYDFQHTYRRTVEHLLESRISKKNDSESKPEKDEYSSSKTKESLCKSYRAIGGVRESFGKHADEIYSRYVDSIKDLKSKKAGDLGLDDTHKRIFEVLLRRMTNYEGEFVPTPYGEILELFSVYDLDLPNIRDNYLSSFILSLGEKELGFLEIIRSTNQTDRTRFLIDKEYISDNDVITVSNPCLVSLWPKLAIFHKAKIKLINDYEWYSRLAYERKNSKSEDYPSTLGASELSNPNRQKSLDSDSIKAIDEISYLNEDWAKLTFGNSREGLASVKETQQFIKDGIRFWKEKVENEIKKRKRKEKLKSRTFFSVVCFLILFVVAHRYLLTKRHHIEDQFDCLVSENKRISSYIDYLEIYSLREISKEINDEATDSMKIEALKVFCDSIEKSLKKESKILSKNWYSIYEENDLDFVLHYSSWKKTRDSLINRELEIYNSVFKMLRKNEVMQYTWDLKVEKKNLDYIDFVGENFYASTRTDKTTKADIDSVFHYKSSVTQLKNDTLTHNLRCYPYYLSCEKCGDEEPLLIKDNNDSPIDITNLLKL